MKILIAPNALKGSLSAIEAAETIGQSLPQGWHGVSCPIADGGDGTLDCLVKATNGAYFRARVSGPLAGQKVTARWGVLGDHRTAVIEMAEAAGLRLLKPERYDVCNSTTYGVGELISTALDSGYRKIIVGLGGSSTNDGGAGCAQALGARFSDSSGLHLPPGGIHLRQLAHIEIAQLDKRLEKCEIVSLYDVRSVLFGPSGTARTFAVQKGATAEQVALLDTAMRQYSECLSNQVHSDAANIEGSGAAGGLGAGLMAFCRARLVSGIDFVLDVVRFDDLLADCDMVLTAEGQLDGQTLRGKGIFGITARARKHGKPVHVFAGRVSGDNESLRQQLGVESIRVITPSTVSEDEAIGRAGHFLKVSVQEFVSDYS